MPSNLNTVLADCEQQAKNLVEEISKYRAAGALSDQTTKSLETLCKALRDTHQKIQPFEAVFARRIVIILGSALLVNFVLLVAILILLFSR